MPSMSAILSASPGVYSSILGPPLTDSTTSLRAACPRQNDEKCRDLEKSQQGPALCAISKTSSGPRYAQTAAEKCRGVGAFLCVVLGSDSGLTMCETHPYKTLDPTPFSSIERSISERLGSGMRLPCIPYSSARHPYCVPVLGHVLPR